jgi:RNA polymerase sigma-70 factor (ECF subfamily)
MVRALANRHRFERGTNLRAWLFTIMHNEYVSNCRQAARQVMTVAADLSRTRAAALDDPEVTVLLHEVGAAVAALPDDQREALVAATLHSYEDAAALLDLSEGTLRSRSHRARRQLRRHCDAG